MRILDLLSIKTIKEPDPGIPKRPLAITKSASDWSIAIMAFEIAGVLLKSAKLVLTCKYSAGGMLNFFRTSFMTSTLMPFLFGTTIFALRI